MVTAFPNAFANTKNCEFGIWNPHVKHVNAITGRA